MASQKLLEMLNEALAMDLRAIIQYMWQHVMAMGVEGVAVSGVFKDIAMQEMKHAESFADRLFYLGGKPTTKPMEIKVGVTLKEMAEADLKAENESIKVCKEIIKMATEEGYPATRLLVEKILEDTEEHADKFTRMLAAK
jgi:bacterioferritin